MYDVYIIILPFVFEQLKRFFFFFFFRTFLIYYCKYLFPLCLHYRRYITLTGFTCKFF